MSGAPQPSGRLHPWSWLFHAAGALKELALPVLAVVVLKRNDDFSALGVAVGAAALACAYGWLRARSFRYEVLAEEILIREGLLMRESRQVPFTRVQSVSERRGLVHRLVGVTELVLESGSGGKPEAVMRVLGPGEASRLAEQLRLHRAARAAGAGEGTGAAAEDPNGATGRPQQVLLTLPTVELVKLGIISNRGLLVVATGIGVLSQNPDLLDLVPGAEQLAESVYGRLAEAASAGLARLLPWILGLLAAVFVLVRLLSLGYWIVTQHGFTLTRDGDRLRVQRGLLTRVDVSGRVGAIQRLVLERTLLHRLFSRCTLRVDLPAALVATGHVPRLNRLAPIATSEQAQALIRDCLPGLDLQTLAWRRLHPDAARRRWERSMLWLMPAVAPGVALAWWLPGLPADAGPVALAAAAVLVAGSAWHARLWATSAAYAADQGVVAWRSGVFGRTWVLVPEGRTQVVTLRRSPRDRRVGTATLCADAMTATGTRALRLPWLAEADAAALNARLWHAGVEALPRNRPGPSPGS